VVIGAAFILFKWVCLPTMEPVIGGREGSGWVFVRDKMAALSFCSLLSLCACI
jgi:hypothetical protein